MAFLPKQVNNPYFDTAATGGQKAAAELGGQFKQVGPSTATGAAQVPFIQDLTTQKVSALTVASSSTIPARRRTAKRASRIAQARASRATTREMAESIPPDRPRSTPGKPDLRT